MQEFLAPYSWLYPWLRYVIPWLAIAIISLYFILAKVKHEGVRDGLVMVLLFLVTWQVAWWLELFDDPMNLYGVALAMPLAYFFLGKHRLLGVRIFLGVVLAVLSVLATLNYLSWGNHRGGKYLNSYEFYHYYIGAKYSYELGHFDTYRATLIADDETGMIFNRPSIRNLRDYSWSPVSQVLAEREEIKGLFTPERWEEFTKDIAYFKESLGTARYQGVLRDKGYNATPVWNSVGRFLTHRISTDNDAGMMFLALLDILLLGAAVGMVAYTFGWRVAALLVMFIGTHFVMSFSHFKGAFLRVDWAAMCIMAVCQLKLNRHATAGAMLSYAALVRIFPLIFIGGMIGKALWDIKRTRSLSMPYRRFFVGFVGTTVALIGVTLIESNGVQQWQGFKENMELHSTGFIGAWRVGFPYILMGASDDSEGWRSFVDRVEQNHEDRRYLRWFIQAAILALTVVAVRNVRDYESVAMSFVPLFFLISSAFYFYMLLAVPFFFFAPRILRMTRAIGLIYIFGTTIWFTYLHAQFGSLGVRHSWIMSMSFLALALYMLVLGLIEKPQPAAQAAVLETEEDTSAEGNGADSKEEEAQPPTSAKGSEEELRTPV